MIRAIVILFATTTAAAPTERHLSEGGNSVAGLVGAALPTMSWDVANAITNTLGSCNTNKYNPFATLTKDAYNISASCDMSTREKFLRCIYKTDAFLSAVAGIKLATTPIRSSDVTKLEACVSNPTPTSLSEGVSTMLQILTAPCNLDMKPEIVSQFMKEFQKDDQLAKVGQMFTIAFAQSFLTSNKVMTPLFEMLKNVISMVVDGSSLATEKTPTDANSIAPDMRTAEERAKHADSDYYQD
jgi:hypothetical protein